MAFDHEIARELHEQLLEGTDPSVPARIAELVFRPLVDRLRYKWPDADHADLEETAAESVAKYLQAPRRYDPERSAMLTWLTLDAHGDLRNAYDARRRRPSEQPRDHVALSAIRRNHLSEEDRYSLDESGLVAQVVEAFPDITDRRLIALMMEGDRSVASAAEAMGISDLAQADKEREVKKAKDRIRKRLRRLLDTP